MPAIICFLLLKPNVMFLLFICLSKNVYNYLSYNRQNYGSVHKNANMPYLYI